MEEDAFEKEAEEIKAICREYGVPFIVNDNVEVAMRCGADGVHVGQRDMEAGEVRKKIGSHRILGVSAQTVEQAVLAQQRGADYLGVGSVFPTSTKLDADAVSLETLRQICAAVSIPVVAIGGITEENVTLLKGSGHRRCSRCLCRLWGAGYPSGRWAAKGEASSHSSGQPGAENDLECLAADIDPVHSAGIVHQLFAGQLNSGAGTPGGWKHSGKTFSVRYPGKRGCGADWQRDRLLPLGVR